MQSIALGIVCACLSTVAFTQFSGEIKNKQSLETALKNSMIVVDFHGEAWCGPCRKMSPIFKAVAQKFDGVKFFKCNIDEYEITGIQGVPTFVFYKDGKEIKRFSGVKTETEFTKVVKEIFDLKDDAKPTENVEKIK